MRYEQGIAGNNLRIYSVLPMQQMAVPDPRQMFAPNNFIGNGEHMVTPSGDGASGAPMTPQQQQQLQQQDGVSSIFRYLGSV